MPECSREPVGHVMSPRRATSSSSGDSAESRDRSAPGPESPGPKSPGPESPPTSAAAPPGVRSKGTGGCVFDRIADGELAAEVILDEPEILAFLDHRPLFAGHTLVIPRLHVSTLAELTPGLDSALLEACRRIAAAQRKALGCQGTFLALNDVVSQSVPHVHFHVVPRTRGDGLRGFFWPRTRYAAGEAAEVAARLRDALGTASGPRQPADDQANDP